MSTRMASRTCLKVESLEGRIALSAAAPVAHPRPLSPIVADLTPQQASYPVTVTDATIDPRIGVVTIRGTATTGGFPSVDTYTVTVIQAVDRTHSVSGTMTARVTTDGPGTPRPFVTRLTAGLGSGFGVPTGGRFGRGLATVVIEPVGPFGALPGPTPTVVVVRLRPARFS
jgi:hypothetical protein